MTAILLISVREQSQENNRKKIDPEFFEEHQPWNFRDFHFRYKTLALKYLLLSVRFLVSVNKRILKYISSFYS